MIQRLAQAQFVVVTRKIIEVGEILETTFVLLALRHAA